VKGLRVRALSANFARCTANLVGAFRVRRKDPAIGRLVHVLHLSRKIGDLAIDGCAKRRAPASPTPAASGVPGRERCTHALGATWRRARGASRGQGSHTARIQSPWRTASRDARSAHAGDVTPLRGRMTSAAPYAGSLAPAACGLCGPSPRAALSVGLAGHCLSRSQGPWAHAGWRRRLTPRCQYATPLPMYRQLKDDTCPHRIHRADHMRCRMPTS
jgi:hypothetical protein